MKQGEIEYRTSSKITHSRWYGFLQKTIKVWHAPLNMCFFFFSACDSTTKKLQLQRSIFTDLSSSSKTITCFCSTSQVLFDNLVLRLQRGSSAVVCPGGVFEALWLCLLCFQPGQTVGGPPHALEWPSDWDRRIGLTDWFSSEGATEDGSMVLLHGKGGVANLDNQPTWTTNDQQRAYNWHYHLRKKGSFFFEVEMMFVYVFVLVFDWPKKLNKVFLEAKRPKGALALSKDIERRVVEVGPHRGSIEVSSHHCPLKPSVPYFGCRVIHWVQSASKNLKIWMFELFEPLFFGMCFSTWYICSKKWCFFFVFAWCFQHQSEVWSVFNAFHFILKKLWSDAVVVCRHGGKSHACTPGRWQYPRGWHASDFFWCS